MLQPLAAKHGIGIYNKDMLIRRAPEKEEEAMGKVAVIAGTPVDTRMGVEYIERKNRACGRAVAQPLYRPVSEDCDAQVVFQYSPDDAKRRRMDEIFDPAAAEGVRDFFIYCNSLSGAFDFDAYAAEKGVRVYTPLQVYRTLGKRFARIGTVAANNLSAYNIEKNLMLGNEHVYMVGTGNMVIVHSIEQGLPPAEIVRRCGLEAMVRYFEANGCECILLGCTHFPYLRAEIEKLTALPLVDPAEEMFEAMRARLAAEAEA